MRNLLCCILFLSVFIACNNRKKTGEVTYTSEDGKEKATVNTNMSETQASAMQQKAEELQKLTPVTTDELKALLPEELMGARRSDVQATTATGTAMATAQYDINDSTDLSITIWDCGGPGGAGIYSLQYVTMFSYEADSDEEYTKAIEFDGKKGIEQCSKVDKDCKLIYFGGDRYLVSLEAENLTPDELKKISEKVVD